MSSIYMLNGISVGIFGILLSAAFCDILWTRKRRLLMAGSIAVILILQGTISLWLDADTIRCLYPVITHIPLTIVLCILSKKRLWPPIAVLTAYLCCELRRWLALLIVAAGSGGFMMQNVVEFVITLPLLFVLLRFVAPSVRSISHYTALMQCQFGLIPALGYGFDYLTRVYTDLLSKGNPAAVEFMPFVCSAAYLIFVLHTSAEERVRSQLEQTQSSLNLQIAQAVREIELLRRSQWKTKTYRHDLRHHMQYLLSCIENERLEQAQAYIHEICLEIEANKVTAFCENETANLIFSAFAGRAEEHDIPIEIKAKLPRILPVSESDLCVLLSNALENALHACQKRKEKGLYSTIEVSAYEKNGKFFFQIINPCDADITFNRGIPVTNKPGHGIGVRSICAIAERYNGIYNFSVENGRFILRVSL